MVRTRLPFCLLALQILPSPPHSYIFIHGGIPLIRGLGTEAHRISKEMSTFRLCSLKKKKKENIPFPMNLLSRNQKRKLFPLTDSSCPCCWEWHEMPFLMSSWSRMPRVFLHCQYWCIIWFPIEKPSCIQILPKLDRQSLFLSYVPYSFLHDAASQRIAECVQQLNSRWHHWWAPPNPLIK